MSEHRCIDCSCDIDVPGQCDWCHGYDDGIVDVLKTLPETKRLELTSSNSAMQIAWDRYEAKMERFGMGSHS